MNDHTGIAALSAPLLSHDVTPETAAEHARNCLQWLQFVVRHPDGTYRLTGEQMAGLAMRLNRIAYGNQAASFAARAIK